MGNLLQLQAGMKSFGARELFRDASFAVDAGEHIGVIGPNGAGKSTLFKILVGVESLDEGRITYASGLRLGYLAQEDSWPAELTVEDYLSRDLLTPIWELKALGLRMGLNQALFEKPIASLSGGYRMRVKLLHLLGSQPDLMLLDEPTNYLDLETLLVLEDFLLDFKGAFLLISHDREFLRRTTDHILEVEAGEMTKFAGNIDDYFEQKTMLREQLEKRAMSLAARRTEILDFAARFGAKATKARQAQSRLKSLSKMEEIVVKPISIQTRIRLPEPIQTGRSVLTIERAVLGYGEKAILRDVRLELVRGDHLGIVGFNGAGKSTLLSSLAGELTPLEGRVERGLRVEIAYFAQHVAERLDPKSNVLDEMGRFASRDTTRQEILDLAGSLLFSGDDVRKPVRVLSGGEKSRVALGQVLLRKASCLLLDEPTNHLDFHTVEALTQALEIYQGSVVIVSHDRGFMRRVATKILEIQKGRVDCYPGTYDEYVWSTQKGAMSTAPVLPSSAPQKPSQNRSRNGSKSGLNSGLNSGSSSGSSSGSNGQANDLLEPAFETNEAFSSRPTNWKERKKTLERELRQTEKDLSQIEQVVEELKAKMFALNERLLSVVGVEAAQCAKELGEIQSLADDRELRWLELLENREQLQFEIQRMKE